MPIPVTLKSGTRAYKEIRAAQQGRPAKSLSQGSAINSPLFSGTLHLVRPTIHVTGIQAPFTISPADASVALDFTTRASEPIATYASQYGPNSLSISQTILDFETTISSTTYEDSALQSWINQIVTSNGLSINDGLIFLNPPGLVDKQQSLSMGTGGYHGKASCAYAFVNVRAAGLTLSDQAWHYAGSLSHEIAELVVDPLADDDNPEVCDPCGPNCASTFLNYFDQDGEYIATSQDFPPSFPYTFFINGIAKTSYAWSCPPSDLIAACSYAPLDTFAMTSATSPSVTASKDQLFAFAVTNDGQPIMNSVAPKKAFDGWRQIPGLTFHSPVAATVCGTTLVMFARTDDGVVHYNRAFSNQPLQGWQALPGIFSTPSAPAAAAVPTDTFVFARDTFGEVHFNHAMPGQAWAGWQVIPGRLITDAAPAAVIRDSTLFVFAKTLDGLVHFNQSVLGKPFSGWQQMPNCPKTDVAPACAARPGTLFVFIKDLNGQIQFNQAAASGAFSGWQVTPGGVITDQPPAATTANGVLFVIAREKGFGRLLYNQASSGGAFVGWQWRSLVKPA